MDSAARLAPTLAFLALLGGAGLAPASPFPLPSGMAAFAGSADDPPPLTPVREPTPAEPPAPQDTMIVQLGTAGPHRV